MYQHTFNNHYKYFIDDLEFGWRTSKFQQYTVQVGQVDPEYYQKSNYLKELERVAVLQQKNLGKDFLLFLSGGTDSEIVARTFHKKGIYPTCIIIKFKDNYNIEEVEEATRIANELNFKIQYVEIDVKDFYFSGEAKDLAIQVNCDLLPFLVFFKIIKNLSAPSVLCCELQLDKFLVEPNVRQWCLRSMENLDMAHIRFSRKFNIPVVQEWFSYTPELMLYYLECNAIKKLLTSKYSSISPVKNSILKTLIPDLKFKQKLTGYEKLKAFLFETKEELGILMPENIGDRRPFLTYDELVQQLKGQ